MLFAPEFPALSPAADPELGSRQLVSTGATSAGGDLETRNVPTSGAQAAQDVTVQREATGTTVELRRVLKSNDDAG